MNKIVTTSIAELEMLLATARKLTARDETFRIPVTQCSDNEYCIQYGKIDMMHHNCTSVGKELRDLQCDIAAKLEKMYHMMQTIDSGRKTCLDYTAKHAFLHFPGALFNYNDENGFMRIKPYPINFDPTERDRIPRL